MRTMPITWSTALRTSACQFLGRRKDSASSSRFSSGMGMIRNFLLYPTFAGRMLCGGRDRRGGAAAFRAHDQVQRTCWLAPSARERCTSAGAGDTSSSYSVIPLFRTAKVPENGCTLLPIRPFHSGSCTATSLCRATSPSSSVSNFAPLRRANSASQASVTCLGPLSD
jgi:hypothetical protein